VNPLLATCSCRENLAAPCGAPATQEDMLCDICREAKSTPWATCMAVTLSGQGSFHFGLVNLRLLLGESG
jgi:hypothetical protein